LRPTAELRGESLCADDAPVAPDEGGDVRIGGRIDVVDTS